MKLFLVGLQKWVSFILSKSVQMTISDVFSANEENSWSDSSDAEIIIIKNGKTVRSSLLTKGWICQITIAYGLTICWVVTHIYIASAVFAKKITS